MIGSMAISPLAFSPWVITSITYTDIATEFTLVRGFLYIPYLFITISPIVVTTFRLIEVGREVKGFKKLRIQVLSSSLVVMVLGMLTTNAILPIVLGHSSTSAIAPIWVLISNSSSPGILAKSVIIKWAIEYDAVLHFFRGSARTINTVLSDSLHWG